MLIDLEEAERDDVALANFMAGALEKRARRSGKRPLMTTFSVYNLARNNTFDYSKAKEELGYQTRSYQETIHDEVKWLESAGKIRTAKKTQSSHQKREALAG